MWIEVGNDLMNLDCIKNSCKNVATIDGDNNEFRIDMQIGEHAGGGSYIYTWTSRELRDEAYEKIKDYLLKQESK